MPIPFWLPLLALAGAMASEAEEKPRYAQGEPLDKSIFDIVDEQPMLRVMVDQLAAHLETQPSKIYRVSAVYLSQLGLGDPDSRAFAQMGPLLHSLARAKRHRPIWMLEPEAYTALVNTAPPWELTRDRLPRLPFPAMLIRLPESISVLTAEIPFPIKVSSLLIVEEIPERKWRYLGFTDAQKFEEVAYTQGWFDLTAGTAKAQLVEGQGPGAADYRLTGEDAVWQLLLNLMLALENKHLDGQRVKPRFPRGGAGRRAQKKKSTDEYTIVRLSAPTRAAQEQKTRETTAAGRTPQKRHLRAGHWRSFWVLEPEDRPIYATKPRLDRKGEPMDGHRYKVVQWVFPYWAGIGGAEPPGRYRIKP